MFVSLAEELLLGWHLQVLSCLPALLAAVPGADLAPSRASALIYHSSVITAGRRALPPACCHPSSRDIPVPGTSQLQGHPSYRDILVPGSAQLLRHPSYRYIPVMGQPSSQRCPSLLPSQLLRHPTSGDIPAPGTSWFQGQRCSSSRDIPVPGTSLFQRSPNSRDIPVPEMSHLPGTPQPAAIPVPGTSQIPGTSQPLSFLPGKGLSARQGRVGWGEKGAHVAWPGMGELMP